MIRYRKRKRVYKYVTDESFGMYTDVIPDEEYQLDIKQGGFIVKWTNAIIQGVVSESSSCMTAISFILKNKLTGGASNKGYLWIGAEYSWDGPSGPTWDTPSVMRASLVHDAFYQLMREAGLSPEFKGFADRLFYEIILEDTEIIAHRKRFTELRMVFGRMRAWYFYQGVKWFAHFATKPKKDEDKVLEAP